MSDGAASRRELQEAVGGFIATEFPRWLERELTPLQSKSPELARVIDEVATLSLRGGKRVRAMLFAAGHVAAGGVLDLPRLAGGFFALELLQSYLLIHDDWMDGDDTRRGGPSVHVALSNAYGNARDGEIAAILAGDFASSLAQRALAHIAFPAPLVVRALQTFADIQERVVAGQVLDVRAAAHSLEAVEEMHALKTSSYTTEGPIMLGAILAGAGPESVDLFRAFARPLGIAFQLRDDILGTFGDPLATGKPLYGDLYTKKRTSLVVLASVLPEARPLFEAEASERTCRELAAIIRDHGVLGRVERRIAELVADSREALRRLNIDERGRRCFDETVVFLTERTS